MLKAVCSIGAILLLPSSALAENDGNKLFRFCEESPPLAMAYVQGVVDTDSDHLDAIIAQQIRGGKISVDDLKPLYRNAGNMICVPKNATLGQARDVVCKFLKDQPAIRQKTAPQLVRQALEAAFPCK
jgi:hypothetical protein